MLRVLDLFSGIGGFSLGLERTGGFETVAFCEIDPFCRKVLAKHWPDVPILDDVRTIDATRLGTIDCITGGYPCQPFSQAGRRLGTEDDRHLWPAMFAIIKTVRPAYVIGENVAGHITMGLDEVLSDLEGEGYACRTFVIPACAVDAPHRRDRVWIVAHAGSIGLERRRDGRRKPSRENETPPRREVGRTIQPDAVADTIGRERTQRGTTGRVGGEEPFSANRAWKITSEPLVCRGTHGIPNRMDRLRSLGNSVVPEIPFRIGIAILQAEAGG